MAVRKKTNSDQKQVVSGQGTARPERLNGSAKRPAKSNHNDLSGVPYWRKIEILRERAELKANLMEIWSDDVDIEDLSLDEDEEAHDRYYTTASEDIDSMPDIDDDEMSDLDDLDD
jgi:hypothetical protein